LFKTVKKLGAFFPRQNHLKDKPLFAGAMKIFAALSEAISSMSPPQVKRHTHHQIFNAVRTARHSLGFERSSRQSPPKTHTSSFIMFFVSI